MDPLLVSLEQCRLFKGLPVDSETGPSVPGQTGGSRPASRCTSFGKGPLRSVLRIEQPPRVGENPTARHPPATRRKQKHMSPSELRDLQELARLNGIQTGYTSMDGKPRTTSPHVLKSVLECMGVSVSTPRAIRT